MKNHLYVKWFNIELPSKALLFFEEPCWCQMVLLRPPEEPFDDTQMVLHRTLTNLFESPCDKARYNTHTRCLREI